MFHRRTPTVALTLIRLAYSLAILVSLAFGIGFGFAATHWLLGAPPGQGLAPHSPIYIQAWAHWVISCALASCLLSFPLFVASMILASTVAHAHTALDGACMSWYGSLNAGLEYDPVARRRRRRAFLADLEAYAATSIDARVEVELFLSGGREFQNRDGDWLVERMDEAGLHSRFRALAPAKPPSARMEA